MVYHHTSRTSQAGFRFAVVGALSSAVALATVFPAAASPSKPSPIGPGGDAAPVKTHIAALYRQAEQLTQNYDAAQEEAAKLTIAVQLSQGRLEAGRVDYAKQQSALGKMASSQYEAGGLDDSLALMLADRPDSYLGNAAVADRVSQDQVERVSAAIEDQRSLIQLQRTAADQLAALAQARLQATADRRDVATQLRQAQALLDTLTAPQRHAVAFAEEGADGSAGETAMAGLSSLPPSARARAAIEAAYADLGKPYIYGAEGPDAFDCSGLIQRVWRQAGVELPRTSSEQAQVGQRVPLTAIQPGDLVIYYAGRGHVGLYVGDGKIIHAPHPGGNVRVAPLMSMPVNMVVRV